MAPDEADSFDSLIAAVARIPAHAEAWTPPPELDEYRLLKPLGRGGMGSVWLAQDRLLAREVALKFIAHAEPDAATRERFAIEARAAARLAHVNVVTVHRFGEVAGRPYLVSEYIRGESLDRLAKPVPFERALDLGIALARGLAAAHRHGIVHRDIKPANAILTGDGEVKLVDFGLAKIGGERDDIAPGTIAGTPRYLAPEVRAGEPATRRSDVYQLGCILYELITARAPLLDARDGDVPSLVPHVGHDGARFASVVDRCLRRDPSARFAAGDELREALEALVARSIGGELPAGNPYRGLVAFDAEHRALFFGRGPDIRGLIDRLREGAFVLVTGDSGVGKSSLCRAGALPHVADGALRDRLAWSVIQLVPGQRPLSSLAMLLAQHLGCDEDELLATMRDEPRRVLRALQREGRGLLVFIDQLEELVTLADRDEAQQFDALIGELAVGVPGVRVLATVRSDFLMRIAELPGIGREIARALFLLRPLTLDGAREAITGPARAKGVELESDELVDTLAGSVTELPLLAFTLAQLWDARDPSTAMISARSLEAIGGVHGALARHADSVIDGLLPRQRDAARRMLLRLVTTERTRTRRSAQEFGDPEVLDALVRGRLVVARGEEPPMFELAHEQLIAGWPRFAGWSSEVKAEVAMHARLATAVATWQQLARSKEALWRKRQLAEVAILRHAVLAPAEREFVDLSRRAERRRRLAWRVTAILAPLVAITVYGGARYVARQDLARTVAVNVGEAVREHASALARQQQTVRLRESAFAKFDAGDDEHGEIEWAAARAKASEAYAAYARASRSLEAALLLDTSRSDVRRALAKVTFERLQLADRDEERTDLAARLPLYDDGTYGRRLTAPATLELAITPAAVVTLADTSAEVPLPPALAPGVHVLVARAPDRAEVRLPIMLAPGERRRIELALPAATSVPAGYVYIPRGTFRFGSNDDETMRRFFDAVPMHERTTGAYLIARTETTYAEWIAWLDTLSAGEQQRHAPKIESSATVQAGGALELARVGGEWTLSMTPTTRTYNVRAGTPIEYPERTVRRRQDWLRMPVSGISPEDALAYARWLDVSGRVPHARMCDELEWERGARGVDGRATPHGRPLTGQDANIDITYGRRDGGFGPDEVGSYPASASPFGLLDTAGNVWEMTRGATGSELLMRGGAFYVGPRSAHFANRMIITRTFRHLHAGLRICADAE